MVDNQKQILANLIKKDLQDALTNDSRWKREGFCYYFQDYLKLGEKEILIGTDNEELKKELENNRLCNWDRRIAKIDQREKEYKEKYGKGYHIDELSRIDGENRVVWKDDLEIQDWQEIIGLIDQILPLGEKKYEAKKAEVYAKLAGQPGLTYHSGAGKRFYGIDDEGRGWYHFTVIENGQEYMINVPKEHSALTDFPFDTEGFYIISGINHLPIKEKKKYWWTKEVGLNDSITFTPYNEEEEKSDKPNNRKPIEDNKSNNNQNQPNRQSNSNQNEINKPENKKTFNFLIQYFEKNKITKIELEEVSEGEYKLVITYNNNKTIASEQINNNQEYQSIKKSLEKINKSKLSSQELGIKYDNNSTSNQPKNNNAIYWVCGIGGALIIGIVVGYLLRKETQQKK